MASSLAQLGLVALLVLVNAVLAGSQIALLSLRQGQLQRLERDGEAGRVLAHLAREPSGVLTAIKIGTTLAGFLASATAAVTLAELPGEPLRVIGGAAEPIAVVVVTLILVFVTLVLGNSPPSGWSGPTTCERWPTSFSPPPDLCTRLAGLGLQAPLPA